MDLCKYISLPLLLEDPIYVLLLVDQECHPLHTVVQTMEWNFFVKGFGLYPKAEDKSQSQSSHFLGCWRHCTNQLVAEKIKNLWSACLTQIPRNSEDKVSKETF